MLIVIPFVLYVTLEQLFKKGLPSPSSDASVFHLAPVGRASAFPALHDPSLSCSPPSSPSCCAALSDAPLSRAAAAAPELTAPPVLPSAWPVTLRYPSGAASWTSPPQSNAGLAGHWLKSSALRKPGARLVCPGPSDEDGLGCQLALAASGSLPPVLS